MADKLIIVESPAKANTIKKFLGGNTKVVASMGHIRDLPKSKLGVNVEKNFEPEYINIRGKGDLIKSLKKDAKEAKKVYLATDPDREGEAIAWHLAHILEIDDTKGSRVTFNEITKTAVQKAIKEPRDIDKNLVDAQQARRVLDRIVGYKISPVLWKKVQKGLSAGRVQSVAVKLIVDREEEIEKFIPQEYWNIYVKLLDEKSKKIFEAKFYGKDNKKVEIHNKGQVEEILSNIKEAKYIVEVGKLCYNVPDYEKRITIDHASEISVCIFCLYGTADRAPCRCPHGAGHGSAGASFLHRMYSRQYAAGTHHLFLRPEGAALGLRQALHR